MSKRLIMIDGNSLLFRAFFAMRDMVTREGIHTQGIFAFINMLNKILKDYEPDYIGVAFDRKAKTFRHLKYPAYKAGRQQTPIELLSEIPLMQDVLRAMNIAVMSLETYEADDIIGTITRMASEQGIESIVITGDKDELQLIDENTSVVINRKGMTEFDFYDIPKMEERYGLTPAQFIDLKGLMGDKSDNIPGIPGVGEKKGIALLKEYGSMDSILEHADEIKGKLGESVRENRELAVLSKELATICRTVPIDVTIEDLLYREPNYPELIALYQKLEFNQFLKKLERPEEAPPAETEESEATVEAESVEMERFFQLTGSGSPVVIDYTGEADHVSEPHFQSIRLYDPSENLFAEKPLTAFDAELFLRELREKEYRLTGMNLKDFLYIASAYGLSRFRPEHDIVVAEYLIDPNRSKYEWDGFLLKYVKSGSAASLSLSGRLKAIASIACEQRKLLSEMALTELFQTCEMPLIPVLASMEREGITVERESLRSTGKELEGWICTLEEKIHGEAGRTFNINSPKQLGAVLFEELQIPYPKGKKGKSGFSTAADVLGQLAEDYPIVNDVLSYRKATKLKSTYIEGLLALIGGDGKIHPHFMQTVAATGRLSCVEPNLQNIPIRDDYGRNIRKAFVPAAGHVFIGADYSQIELRILAALSEDEVLIEAFNRGDDIHRLTASRVFNIPMEAVTALDRSRAKAVNFGVIYGMSGFGLSEELHITRADAQGYIDDYFEKHTKVRDYMEEQKRTGLENRAVRTMFGRIRQIPEYASRKFMDIQLANRLAMNTPIQGSAADIIKFAMIAVHEELDRAGLRAKLILQIHDELIIEAPKEEEEEVTALLVRCMENAASLAVRLVCDVHAGTSWYDLK